MNIQRFAIPKGKVRALAQFNKISGALTGVLNWVESDVLNHEYFVYREIEFDFETDVVVGTVEDYEVVARDSLPEEIRESTLNLQAQQRITKEYPVVRQINILAEAVAKIGEATGVELEELHEMLDYIDEVLRENKIRKSFYESNNGFIYKSDEDLAREEAAQLEGGLHEAYGGRQIVGGSVF